MKEMQVATERMNFAVIGCGLLARSQHIPNIAKSPKTVLHTCCDVSDEALAECRDKHGVRRITKDYKEAIADPEVQAICLATTQALRVPVIRAAAEAGKPVYCEKPLANSLEEMYEIRKIVHDSKIPFCVGHNRRCSPAMIEGRRIFRSHMEHPEPCAWRYDREGAVRPRFAGDGVASISVRINDDWYSWKCHAFNAEFLKNGPMLWEMTHFTDICNWFLAAEPSEVAAIENGIFGSGVVIKYRTGEMATISMAGNGTFGYMKELYEAFGNGAAVVVDHMLEVRTAGIEGAPDRIVYPMLGDRHPKVGTELGVGGWLAKKRAACKEAAAKNDSMLIFTAEPDKGHAHAVDCFVDEIRGVGPVVCGVDDAISATRICFAAVRAAHERRCVNMSEI